MIQPCNSQDCTSGTWDHSAWSECTATCGGGTRTRTVTCVPTDDDPECERAGVKLPTEEACNTPECVRYYRSIIQPFGNCSVECGGGFQFQTSYYGIG